MANKEHVERLKRSVTEWNDWRREHPTIWPDLSGADLSKINLSGVDLCEADLGHSDLHRANLSHANLHRADLHRANLGNANLQSADLSKASLTRANLSSTDLGFANLTTANLGYTIFAWADLCNVNGLETIVHHGPSSVDLLTVKLPQDERCRHFLRGAGFPDTFIDYLPSLLTGPIQYHSLFLSYSHHDQVFTKRLHNDLQNQGVRCWFAPHDLRPGTPIVRGIEEAIHLHEKLLLILSHHAVNSPWVQQEVEAALHKEVTTGQEILFPIRLDNTVLESDTLWAKRLRQRHIGDFTNWSDEQAYQEAFTLLLRHLKVTTPPTV